MLWRMHREEDALENGSFTAYFINYNQRRRHKEGARNPLVVD